MQSIKIYLCDDEPRMLKDLTERVQGYMPEGSVRGFLSGAALMEALLQEPCDILLLDIDMPEKNGMDIAAWLQQQEIQPLLVFVTGHDELVYDSLWYHPFGFIRKGFLSEELDKVLDACKKELGSRMRYFSFRAEGRDVRVLLADIRYFEADGNYLRVFLEREEYRVRSTVTAVEEGLNGCGFIRIHKGFLVNQSAVRILGGDEVQLMDGTTLPMGKTYAEEARKQWMRYMRG